MTSRHISGVSRITLRAVAGPPAPSPKTSRIVGAVFSCLRVRLASGRRTRSPAVAIPFQSGHPAKSLALEVDDVHGLPTQSLIHKGHQVYISRHCANQLQAVLVVGFHLVNRCLFGRRIQFFIQQDLVDILAYHVAHAGR